MISNDAPGRITEQVLAGPDGADLTEGEPGRVLGLTGAINLRDVGGYRTVDGRRVRWRALLRCGAMHALDDDARSTFADIGLRTVVDLREISEVTREPDALGTLPVTSRHIPIYTRAASGQGSAAKPASGQVVPPASRLGGLGGQPAAEAGPRADAQQPAGQHRQDSAGEAVAVGAATAVRTLGSDGAPITLESVYNLAVDERGDRLTAAVLALAAPGALPALVHCSAGKDRTGMVIALVLALLGVPDDTIAADYALTARYLIGEIAEAVSVAPNGKRVPEQLMGCPPELIVATLARIRARHGDIPAFLLAHGATPAALDTLREALLDDGSAR
ncbi:protein-tyrosine phosphatase [Frankia sp. AiPs1]|uniref:tyrosine-protein phosphatase n=1 Tax=Frankia sp. AiPa1 TaxID=573492 RepID=UPI00202B07B0|nr:tyrosine-protein phosphatase [Frankia sp. AiPa1]MCL9761423.1 tyrosine-protein phosphatase [Frankia sp. AiPa1]